MAGKVRNKDVASMSFEEALKELQSMTEKMSQGGLSLEESVKAYTRGVELSKHCQQLLDKAKEEIEICDKELSEGKKQTETDESQESGDEPELL